MSQGDSPYGYFKQMKCLSFFFSTKSENKKAEQVLSGGLVPVRTGRLRGEGIGG
jgi:hypothetical protein